MKKLLLFTVLSISDICLAQTEAQRRQNIEYKSLSQATQRAFSVPQRPATNISTYKSSVSSISSSSSSNSSNQSSSANSYSSNNDSYSWAMTGQFERKQKLGAAIDAKNKKSMDAYNSNVAIVEGCYKKFPKNKENYQQIFNCAISSGCDYYIAYRIIGFSADDLQSKIDLANAAKEEKSTSLFEGSTKADCSGDCTETLYYKDRSGIYIGNTKGNRPHGKGVLTLSNGDKLTGNFVNGNLVGDIVYNFADGNLYEGGFYRAEFTGEGKFTFTDGEINQGTFLHNKLNGFGTITTNQKKYSGIFKDGQLINKGQKMIEYASGTKYLINYDNPNQSTITWKGGTNFIGLVDDKFIYRNGKLDYGNGEFFDGEFDQKGNYVNGKQQYKDGSSFIGTFVNGIRRKGTFTNDKYIFTGIYNDDGKNFKVGNYQTKDKLVTCEAFFGINNTKNGYRIDYTPTGGINETIYNNEQNTGPIRYTNKNNDVLVGTNIHEKYTLYGMLREKSGGFYPAALLDGTWITLPEPEREYAMKVATETIQILEKARAEYENAIK